MNAAGIRALEQARGYYREGVKSAERRMQEAEKAAVEAREQRAKAQVEVDQLDAALAEAKGVNA